MACWICCWFGLGLLVSTGPSEVLTVSQEVRLSFRRGVVWLVVGVGTWYVVVVVHELVLLLIMLVMFGVMCRSSRV